LKTGLVLEGGGMRGIYTAGILDAFMEHDINFDGVIGVSAGAIHGCSFVSRQKGRSIRYYKKYCQDPRFMSFKSLITTGDFVGAEFCYHELPEKLDVYDNDAFQASSTDFYITCTDLETGKAVNHLVKDMFKEVEQEGTVLVIRPVASLNIGRLENNPEKIQEIYDIGYQDGMKMAEKVKAFLAAE